MAPRGAARAPSTRPLTVSSAIRAWESSAAGAWNTGCCTTGGVEPSATDSPLLFDIESKGTEQIDLVDSALAINLARAQTFHISHAMYAAPNFGIVALYGDTTAYDLTPATGLNGVTIAVQAGASLTVVSLGQTDIAADLTTMTLKVVVPSGQASGNIADYDPTGFAQVRGIGTALFFNDAADPVFIKQVNCAIDQVASDATFIGTLQSTYPGLNIRAPVATDPYVYYGITPPSNVTRRQHRRGEPTLSLRSRGHVGSLPFVHRAGVFRLGFLSR